MARLRLSDAELAKKRVERWRFGKWRPLRYLLKECAGCGTWIRFWHRQPCKTCRIDRWFRSLRG